MYQNQRSDENKSSDEGRWRDNNDAGSCERSGEKQGSGEENGVNTDEEIGGSPRSGEETGVSDEEIGDNQRSDEETSVYQSSDEDWDEEEQRCIVSDPAQPHDLFCQWGYKTKEPCFSCGKKNIRWKFTGRPDFHYYCRICKVEFHRGCIKLPSKMIHPYHPQHPLTFSFLHKKSGKIVNTNYGERYNLLKLGPTEFSDAAGTNSNSSIMFDKCTWCGHDLRECFYRCLICNFSLDCDCAAKRPPLTIQNPKGHHHPLSLFPRPLSFPCNACGLIDVLEAGYACYQCNYVVHQSCIDLPRVIKITRHGHRLSHNPYLPAKFSPCRICYKIVDIKYGQYSCNQGDCSYVVHSKCATHRKIWAGRELEWAPEEPDETEDPFKRVGDGLIEHFCHGHHYLRLEKYDSVTDSKKQCQACMRPISSYDFFNCVECDFFLHEVCANLPRKLEHASHIHPIYMDPYPPYHADHHLDLRCSLCLREFSGFKYICREKECTKSDKFQLDINCVLVPECFTHKSHTEHPLFLTTYYSSNDDKVLCMGCKYFCHGYYLHCTLCEFVLCYSCATIPYEMYYKGDEHLLLLCYGERGVDDVYWCEVCETSLDPTEWFYICNECCITIHHFCLYGRYANMKSGHTFDYWGKKVEVVGNASSSRPICRKCHQHCPDPVYFKVYRDDTTDIPKNVCSLDCC